MSKKIGLCVGGIGCAAAVLLAGITMFAQIPAPSALECPILLDFQGGVSGEVIGVQFIDRIDGVKGNKIELKDEQKAKFRLALVTYKIRKPANKSLTLAAADVTLHYNHGDKTEVAPSEGLSFFSTTRDGERPMDLSQSMGPGFVKSTTTAKCIAATEIYADSVFCFMEPETRECWVCIGQPLSRKPVVTQGYKF